MNGEIDLVGAESATAGQQSINPAASMDSRFGKRLQRMVCTDVGENISHCNNLS